ncbi:MAG TPA: carbohydrate kinase family protein [Candidatus Korarchaeota archaeon]|nr:carbohydrate kinase family protein [Candidatus Korarchaeota archaeon]
MGNEIETRSLCQKYKNEVIEKLRKELGAMAFVVKAGEKGCRAIWNGGIELILSKKVKVVDTTGAGDAYNAGFLFGISNGLKPSDACRLGNALVRYKCEGEGARYLPTLDQLISRWSDLRIRSRK